MAIVVFLIFAPVAAIAALFAVLPLLRPPHAEGDRRRPLVALIVGCGIVVAGLGVYALLGAPQVAAYSFTDVRPDRLTARDYPALIATLARRMPSRPGDVEGWTLLGRGYLALGDADQAQKALAMAVSAAKAEQGGAPAAILASYGEAIAQAAGGVTKEAEAVFHEALAEDPKDITSRLYLGMALAERGEKEQAMALWKDLPADLPPDSPLRSVLIDRMAALQAQAGGMPAGGPAAMVARLASELEANPNDLQGWLRLINAYTVLGERDKASAALSKARTVFARQTEAQAALEQLAKEKALN